MSKEEKIKEAYGEYWDDVKNHIDENGWVNLRIAPEYFLRDKKFDAFDKGKERLLRPISLKGIENNNGWISVLSENDLPNENCFIECISNRKNPDMMRLFEIGGFKSLRFIHYFDCERDKDYLMTKAESYKVIPFYPPIY